MRLACQPQFQAIFTHTMETRIGIILSNYLKFRKPYTKFLYIELSIWYESLQGPRPLRAKSQPTASLTIAHRKLV